MSRHEVYYQPLPVPCACGLREAYWHGPKDGIREYCCERCWNLRECVAALKALVNVFDPDRQSIYRFAQPQIEQARTAIANVEG